MGVDPEVARGAIRVSLGFSTTEEEVDCFLNAGKGSFTHYLRGYTAWPPEGGMARGEISERDDQNNSNRGP